jgi:hypothetical protein
MGKSRTKNKAPAEIWGLSRNVQTKFVKAASSEQKLVLGAFQISLGLQP